MKVPQISVIIPSYNHANYIGEAIESVLSQTHRDLELIVVDDGSTDNSQEVLGGFKDPRLHPHFQENQGAHAAINRGLQEARGKYLAILNSDDVYHPQRLEKALVEFNGNPLVGLVSSHIEIIDRQGRSMGIKHGYLDYSPWDLSDPSKSFRAEADLRAALLTENFLATTSNYVFSRKLYQQVGKFLPLRYTHDWDFALRAMQFGELRLLPEALMSYRVHEGNTIRENQAAMIFEICWILAVHMPQAASSSWFQSAGWRVRTQQMLNSIYTYGCERILTVMLLQNLKDTRSLALQLLDPEDPVRWEYLEAIRMQLLTSQDLNVDIELGPLSRIRRAARKFIHR
jgi:glycosyltransferase involved in cell wall biosynthesis